MTKRISRRTFLTAAGVTAAGAAAARLLAGRGGSGNIGGPDVTAVSNGTNSFAADLYGRLKGEPGNTFFSPFSVSTILALTAAGAKGDTLAQMRKALRLPADAAATHAGFGGLLAAVNAAPGEKRGYDLSAANAIWAQAGYPWANDFTKLAEEKYRAAARSVNFAADPDAARKTINQWVETETRDKIKDLLAPGTVTALTRMVLTNAVYFKGTWAEQFSKAATKDQPFFLADGSKTTAPLMYRKGRVSLFDGPDFQAAELPYTGGGVSMLVVLPRTPDGLPAVEGKLSAESLAEWTGQVRPTGMVDLYLPRFKVEARYSLVKPLQALGMKDAFDPAKADFSGLVSSLPEGKLAITEVAHKAFVDVNEEGTEAAAATGVVVGVRSAPARPTVFRADRPFLFLLRHTPTNAVLFLGRVSNPRG